MYTNEFLCTGRCGCTQEGYYVQRNNYVHKRIGTYTVKEAHWFKSSFTGNNAPFNTNGMQCIYRRNGKRMIEVYLCLSKKVSVLCTDKSCILHENYLICTKKICMYIKNVGTYTVRVAHCRWINKRMKTKERSLFMFEY